MTKIQRYEMNHKGVPEPDDNGVWVFRKEHDAIVAALQEQVQKLAALAEERRVFIVNGAEMGYIQLPVFDDDPATSTYQRCLLKPKFAADAVIREIGAKAVEGFGDVLGLGSLHLALILKKCAYEHAAKLRAGEQP